MPHRILIVEDDPLVGEDLYLHLTASGYDVLGVAATGEEAVQIAVQKKPDLVIMDIKLSGEMDGIQAAGLIRERVDAAILYLTAYANDSDLAERAKLTEPSAYVDKAVTPLELKNTVEMALCKHEADKRIRESEEKYRTLVETAPNGIVEIDVLGTITSFNSAYCRIMGYDSDELTGRSILDLSENESAKELLSGYLESLVLDQPEPTPWIGRNVTKDGRIIDVEADWNYRRDSLGNVIGFIAVVTDFTARRKTEEALREERKRLATLAEHSPFGLVMINKEGNFDYVNPKFNEIFEYDLDEVPSGRAWFRNAFPDQTYRREVIASWVDDLSRFDPGEQRPRIYSVRCKDGTEKTIHFRPVQLDTGGHLMTCEDITDRTREEEAPKTREEYLRMITDNIPALISYVGADQRYRFANRKYEKGFGLTRDEIIGKHIREVLGDSGYQAAEGHIREALRGEYVTYEHSLPIENQQRWLRVHYVPDTDSGGEVRGFFTMVSDLSDRKLIEEALRESEERFRELYENLRDGVAEVDERGRFVRCNSQYLQMLGYSLEELAGLTYEDVTPARWHAMESRIREEQIDARGYSDLYEKEYIHKNGNILPIEIQTYLAKDLDGKKTGYWAFARDITERKEAEQSLKESKELFEKTFLSQRDAILILEASNPPKILDCNPMTTEIFGYTRKEVLGRTTDFLHVDETMLRQFQDHVYPAIEERGYLHLAEFAMRRKDGTLFPTEHSVVPLEAGRGERIGWVSVIRDISERKRAEDRIKASLQEKEVLVREIHHRVKNNLAVVTSLLRLESRNSHDQTVRSMFGETEARIRSMALAYSQLYETENLAQIDARKYLTSLLTHLDSSMGRSGGHTLTSEEIEETKLQIDTATPLGFCSAPVGIGQSLR